MQQFPPRKPRACYYPNESPIRRDSLALPMTTTEIESVNLLPWSRPASLVYLVANRMRAPTRWIPSPHVDCFLLKPKQAWPPNPQAPSGHDVQPLVESTR